MESHAFAHLSGEEKKALFASVTITHRQLEAVHERIRRAIRQPAGFSSSWFMARRGSVRPA